jgi:hypothetical protein
MGDGRGSCRVSAGIPEGERPLGRPRRRWENNVKMDVQEFFLGGRGIDWFDLARDRDRWIAVVNAEMKLGFP